MPRHSFMKTNVWILGPDDTDVEEVPDELFMDMSDGRGTRFLARTCYGRAVKECLMIEDDFFLLRVRPDQRVKLFLELSESYRVSFVYRFSTRPSRRFILTDEMFVAFKAEISEERKRICVREYFRDVQDGQSLRGGIFKLSPLHLQEPIFAWKVLPLEQAIEEAFPVVVDLPEVTGQPAKKELVGTP